MIKVLLIDSAVMYMMYKVGTLLPRSNYTLLSAEPEQCTCINDEINTKCAKELNVPDIN